MSDFYPRGSQIMIIWRAPPARPERRWWQVPHDGGGYSYFDMVEEAFGNADWLASASLDHGGFPQEANDLLRRSVRQQTGPLRALVTVTRHPTGEAERAAVEEARADEKQEKETKDPGFGHVEDSKEASPDSD